MKYKCRNVVLNEYNVVFMIVNYNEQVEEVEFLIVLDGLFGGSILKIVEVYLKCVEV